MVEIEPVELKETQDMHATFSDYIDYYYKHYCKGKFLQKVFREAHQQASEMTDSELAASLRGGWKYDMLTVYLLKRVLVEKLPEAKGKEAKKEACDFNRVLMSQAINHKLSSRSEARKDDWDMRKRLCMTEDS